MDFDVSRSHPPARKFSPPVLGRGQYLHRERLLGELGQGRGRQKKIVFIEAQAGQGKTTLAAQYLQSVQNPFAWYQVGPEDRDPVQFLAALLFCLKNFLPDFSSPQLEKMISDGEITPLDIPRLVRTLLKDFAPHLPAGFCLVLDDVHLLENSPPSLALLGNLLDAPRLRFFLLTRRPVELPSLARFHDSYYLGNRDLALTTEEIFDLYNEILHVPLDGKAARALHETTEGWVMGLILSARAEGGGEAAGKWAASVGKDRLFDYFQAEILSMLPEDLRDVLLRFSLLEDIPTDLAEVLSGRGGVRERLGEFAAQNLFIRRLDEDGSTFRFHHLFHEVLRQQAESEFPLEVLSGVFRSAADFFLARGDVERGLLCLLRLKDYPAVEELLGSKGLRFVAQSRIRTLDALLGGIPEEIVAAYPWIAYFRGIVLIESQPPRALPLLERAGRLFAEQGDARGELLTLAQRLLVHGSIDCRFHLGPALRRRLKALGASARVFFVRPPTFIGRPQG